MYWDTADLQCTRHTYVSNVLKQCQHNMTHLEVELLPIFTKAYLNIWCIIHWGKIWLCYRSNHGQPFAIMNAHNDYSKCTVCGSFHTNRVQLWDNNNSVLFCDFFGLCTLQAPWGLCLPTNKTILSISVITGGSSSKSYGHNNMDRKVVINWQEVVIQWIDNPNVFSKYYHLERIITQIQDHHLSI